MPEAAAAREDSDPFGAGGRPDQGVGSVAGRHGCGHVSGMGRSPARGRRNPLMYGPNEIWRCLIFGTREDDDALRDRRHTDAAGDSHVARIGARGHGISRGARRCGGIRRRPRALRVRRRWSRHRRHDCATAACTRVRQHLRANPAPARGERRGHARAHAQESRSPPPPRSTAAPSPTPVALQVPQPAAHTTLLAPPTAAPITSTRRGPAAGPRATARPTPADAGAALDASARKIAALRVDRRTFMPPLDPTAVVAA